MSISEYLRLGERLDILTTPFNSQTRMDLAEFEAESLDAEDDMRRVINSSDQSTSTKEGLHAKAPALNQHTQTIHTLVDHMDVGTPTGRLAAMVGEYNNALPTAVAIERNIKPTTLDALIGHTDFFIREGDIVEVVAFQTHAVHVSPKESTQETIG